jgi:hypothetical protein
MREKESDETNAYAQAKYKQCNLYHLDNNTDSITVIMPAIMQ